MRRVFKRGSSTRRESPAPKIEKTENDIAVYFQVQPKVCGKSRVKKAGDALTALRIGAIDAPSQDMQHPNPAGI
jgi:hypothetical protein